MPVTKHSYLVKMTDEIGRVVQEAFYIAGTGRPGPVTYRSPEGYPDGDCKRCLAG